MRPDNKKQRTPITYEPANGVLRAGFSTEDHRWQMYVLLATFGDGNWWTEFLHDAMAAYTLTDHFDTMSRSERLRHFDAIKFLATYLRHINGCDGAKGKPSDASRIRVATAILGKTLLEDLNKYKLVAIGG